jgi:hypothetical protein
MNSVSFKARRLLLGPHFVKLLVNLWVWVPPELLCKLLVILAYGDRVQNPQIEVFFGDFVVRHMMAMRRLL